MMNHVRRLLKDERGTSFEGIALSVSIIAIGLVASADALNYVSKKHGIVIGAAVQEAAAELTQKRVNPGIDYTSTGSIADLRNGRTVLDPCTGLKK